VAAVLDAGGGGGGRRRARGVGAARQEGRQAGRRRRRGLPAAAAAVAAAAAAAASPAAVAPGRLLLLLLRLLLLVGARLQAGARDLLAGAGQDHGVAAIARALLLPVRVGPRRRGGSRGRRCCCCGRRLGLFFCFRVLKRVLRGGRLKNGSERGGSTRCLRTVGLLREEARNDRRNARLQKRNGN